MKTENCPYFKLLGALNLAPGCKVNFAILFWWFVVLGFFSLKKGKYGCFLATYFSENFNTSFF